MARPLSGTSATQPPSRQRCPRPSFPTCTPCSSCSLGGCHKHAHTHQTNRVCHIRLHTHSSRLLHHTLRVHWGTATNTPTLIRLTVFATYVFTHIHPLVHHALRVHWGTTTNTPTLIRLTVCHIRFHTHSSTCTSCSSCSLGDYHKHLSD